MALPYTSILAGASGQSSGSITNSARFVSGNSAYLSKTFGTPTTQNTFTLSTWVKRGKLSVLNNIFGVSTNNSIGFPAADTLVVTLAGSATITTTGLWRDPAAWYHIVYKQTTGAATLYVNNVSVGTSATVSAVFNTAVAHQIGAANTSNYLDGYLSNTTFVDGQALTPSSFGQTNTSGVWVPKAYSGTYGTNGFLMEFLNSAALGTDTSGNGNTFTSNGLVAGDQMTDTPTLNYCTLNPLDIATSVPTITSGNLVVASSSQDTGVRGTIGVSSGKYVWEGTAAGGSQNNQIGIASSSAPLSAGTVAAFIGAITYRANGTSVINGTSAAYGAAYTTLDVIRVELDAGGSSVTFFKNGTSQGALVIPGTVAAPWFPVYKSIGGIGDGFTFNFGQTAFVGTPTTNYVALNSTNLPAPAIKDGSAHFQTALHTGTGSAITINQSGNSTFTSDFVWTKGRSGATNHVLSNVISGTGKYLSSNATTAETTDAQALTAFGAGSISYGTLAAANTNAATYVDWMWRGGGAGVSNTSGSIASTVSANTTAGISIVKWTGTAANATVGHGLGVAPTFMILKPNAVTEWPVYHGSLANTEYMALNTTAAKATGATYWNSTSPTSTVFSLGSSTNTNNSSGMVALVFAPISGFSSMGKYTGNGLADGPFIYTGFKPAFIIVKRTDSTSDWRIYDTTMRTYNVNDRYLAANGPDVEAAGGDNGFDIVSNGFKSRNSSAGTNASGGTMIYVAFASNPFGGIGAAPATAR